MRTLRLSSLLAVIASLTTPALAKLKVHEWGTFTVLQGPQGGTIMWYQAQNEVTALPDFVTKPNGALSLADLKASPFGPYAIRMETPVLYFYPDAPMDVKVTVDFPGGVIAESYPHARREASGVSWQGSLLRATPEALKTVPPAGGAAGRHYAAARAVPDAWLFRQAVVQDENGVLAPPVAPAKKVAAPAPETDHFIFYRGAGQDVSRMIQASNVDDRFLHLKNLTTDSVPVLFVLQTGGGKSGWKRVDNLNRYEPRYDEATKKTLEIGLQTVELPLPARPIAESTAGLKTAMLAALEKEGLTKAEAEAMVATWDNVWFEEPGTRVLAVLPQPWVDAVLPIQITPRPESMERVFVARLELISQAQQTALVDLLTTPRREAGAARDELRKLELGRFANGAVAHAVQVKTSEVTQQMHGRFNELVNPAPVPAPK